MSCAKYVKTEVRHDITQDLQNNYRKFWNRLFQEKAHIDLKAEQYKKCRLLITGNQKRHVTKGYVQLVNFSSAMNFLTYRGMLWVMTCMRFWVKLFVSYFTERMTDVLFVSGYRRAARRRPKAFCKCCDRLGSGNRAGHVIQWISTMSRQSWTTLAREQDASMNRNASPTAAGERWTWGGRTSAIHAAVVVPV